MSKRYVVYSQYRTNEFVNEEFVLVGRTEAEPWWDEDNIYGARADVENIKADGHFAFIAEFEESDEIPQALRIT